MFKNYIKRKSKAIPRNKNKRKHADTTVFQADGLTLKRRFFFFQIT